MLFKTELPYILGSTNPQTIAVAVETLDFRRAPFSDALSLLMPALSLVSAPPNFTVELHRKYNAPLPDYIVYSFE